MFFTPNLVAVAGMSCINPEAPFTETALPLNADSDAFIARLSDWVR